MRMKWNKEEGRRNRKETKRNQWNKEYKTN